MRRILFPFTAILFENTVDREIEGRPVASLSMIERLIYDSNVGDRLDFLAERNGETWSGSLELEERR